MVNTCTVLRNLFICNRSFKHIVCRNKFQVYPCSLLNLRKRCSDRALSDIKEKQEGTELKISSKFPGYKVLYIFPYIKHANTINAVKRRLTYFTGAFVPIIIGLRFTDIISFDLATASIINVLILVTWLHTMGIMCNNQVGYIYLSPEKKGSNERKVILSYTNYWGKRIDMEIAFNEIIPLTDNRRRISDYLYKRIFFSSRKEQLKICLKLGQIVDAKDFRHILGTV